MDSFALQLHLIYLLKRIPFFIVNLLFVLPNRLGEYFWGFQEHDVVPDIVAMAKVCTKEIYV